MTSIQDYRNDTPRDAAAIADEIEQELRAINASAATTYGTEHYALIQSVAAAMEDTEESLTELYDASYVSDASGVELTKNARELGVERQSATAATGVVSFQRDSPATSEYTIPSGTVVGTGGDDNVRFETTETTSIGVDETSTQANIECTETGNVGNVGADTITVLVSGSVSGVDSVTNPNPVGSRGYTLTDDQTVQTVGQPREGDASLRDRALQSTAVGGAGTAQAAQLALENLTDVISADVVTNRSNTAENNIPAWNTEVRVYGGEIGEIAETLYETLPLITLETLVGGANGTEQSITLTKPFYGDISVPITRPTTTPLTIELSVVHDSSYAGDVTVKNDIVAYIGGETVDARTVTGLGQGDNVLVNEVENVAEDVQGVDYADVTLLDATGDGTDDTTTDTDGVPVYEVSDTEVAILNAADLTITTTTR